MSQLLKSKTEQKEELIASLAGVIQTGLDAWVKAGEVVVDLLDKHGMSLDEIAAAAQSEMITPHLLGQFERVGRRQVLPKLLVATYAAAAPLQKLPFSEQVRLVAEKVDLVTMRDGKQDVLRVAVSDLTKQQCAQVFDKNGLRSLGAQRAWLEAQVTEAEFTEIKKKAETAWMIKGGKLLVRSGCELSRHELAVILAQLG